MKPLIFHCDCNNFFASCECLTNPELKKVPMAVAGDPEDRVGIVVAKNELAKKAGVKTTDTVWQAKRKCPGIVFVPPRHHYYKQISDQVNQIYHEYTDFVEPASIDESYLDMTGAPEFFHVTEHGMADLIRDRVRNEIGITISVGVSFCKIFAKMGSDYKKPDATTIITPENYQELLWPLPVSDLMFAGKATTAALQAKSIQTIGDLARLRKDQLVSILGSMGDTLWDYANGIDGSKVKPWGYEEAAKSVSHGMTFRKNLETEEEVRAGVSYLADKVASTLRNNNQKGSVVSVHIKTPELRVISRQTSLEHYTWLHKEIMDVSMQLIHDSWKIGKAAPIRALTIGVTKLVAAREETEQISWLEDPAAVARRQKMDKLESAIDAVRKKQGNSAIRMGMLQDDEIGIKKREK